MTPFVGQRLESPDGDTAIVIKIDDYIEEDAKLNPNGEAGQAFQSLGLDPNMKRDELFNAAMRKFSSTDFGDKQLEMMTTLFGKAGNAMSAAAESWTADVEKANASLLNVETINELDKLGDAFTELKIQLAGPMAKAIDVAIKGFQNFGDLFKLLGDFSTRTKEAKLNPLEKLAMLLPQAGAIVGLRKFIEYSRTNAAGDALKEKLGPPAPTRTDFENTIFGKQDILSSINARNDLMEKTGFSLKDLGGVNLNEMQRIGAYVGPQQRTDQILNKQLEIQKKIEANTAKQSTGGTKF